jgi:DNA-binding CsgD family transcriptional regulator
VNTYSRPSTKGQQLKPKETDVIELLHLDNAEICKQLDISKSTLNARTQRIYKKLGVTNRFAALVWFHGKGLNELLHKALLDACYELGARDRDYKYWVKYFSQKHQIPEVD